MKSDGLPTIEHDTKSLIMTGEKGDGMLLHAPQRRHRSRHLAAGFLIIASFYLLWTNLFSQHGFTFHCGKHNSKSSLEQISGEKKLVPLEAHIMSKCPDAKDCLKMLILPTMQQVYDKVNFTLSFIGTPTDNDGVSCMHGPEECMGNIIELCAENLYPEPRLYLGFTMCLTRDYKDIPQKSLVEDCALEHGIDFNKLNECAVKDNGGYGMSMLRDSVRRSKDAAVTKSCTVRLDEKIYCVRDGGQWKDCPGGSGINDLVVAVEKLYQSS